jgi:UDP-N-acetylglucosamine 2-epimerase
VNQERILESVKIMLSKQTLGKFDQNASLNWNNPFGDGRAGESIVEILEGFE